MKRKIALLMAMLLVATLTLSMGTAFAADPKVVKLMYFENYSPYPPISHYTLTATVSITTGQAFSYTQISSPCFYINGVLPGTPSTVTYAETNDTLKILVTRKDVPTSPTPTYYYFGSGLVGYTGTNPYIYIGNGDYMYAAVESTNPIPNIPVGTIYPLTSGNLAGLSPSNTHLTFSTSNSAVVSNIGAILYGNAPGTAKLYVYYDSSLVIVKDIIVGSGVTGTAGIIPVDVDLVIGPATFNAAKGKSYKFTKCTLDGEVISPSTLLWKSSNTGIATVSKTGVIRALKAGTVTITAKTADGESASVVITVK